jgi:hypothetical protein
MSALLLGAPLAEADPKTCNTPGATPAQGCTDYPALARDHA